MLELNDVLLQGESHTLSLMAHEGQLTCLTCGGDGSSAVSLGRLSRVFYAMLGLEPIASGFVSLDGEPLTPSTAVRLRGEMSFAPCRLLPVGQVTVYEAPLEQDVFALRRNRDVPISNGMLSEEAKRTGMSGQQARLLAVAVLLQRSVLLVECPAAVSMPYLHELAASGRTVIVSSLERAVVEAADSVVEI